MSQLAQGLASEPLIEQLLGPLDVLVNVFDLLSQLQTHKIFLFYRHN